MTFLLKYISSGVPTEGGYPPVKLEWLNLIDVLSTSVVRANDWFSKEIPGL